MKKQFRLEHNLETGEISQIELTSEEIVELQEIKSKVDLERQMEEEKKMAKQSVLSKLGLTAEEAAALLS